MSSMRIISADCHVNEPPTVFDHVPAKLRDRTPKMRRAADGGDGWSFDGGPPKRSFGIEATAGRAETEKKLSGLRFDEILPGNYDGREHVKDMATDGIDVSVVYPNHAIFIYIEPDRDDFLTQLNVVDEPLALLPLEKVRPGPEALEEIMESLR